MQNNRIIGLLGVSAIAAIAACNADLAGFETEDPYEADCEEYARETRARGCGPSGEYDTCPAETARAVRCYLDNAVNVCSPTADETARINDCYRGGGTQTSSASSSAVAGPGSGSTGVGSGGSCAGSHAACDPTLCCMAVDECARWDDTDGSTPVCSPPCQDGSDCGDSSCCLNNAAAGGRFCAPKSHCF